MTQAKNAPAEIIEAITQFYDEYADFLLAEHIIDEEAEYLKHSKEWNILKTVDGLRIMSRNNTKLSQHLRNMKYDAVLPVRTSITPSPVSKPNESGDEHRVSMRRVVAAEKLVQPEADQSPSTLPDKERIEGPEDAPPQEQVWARYGLSIGKAPKFSFLHRVRDISVPRNLSMVSFHWVCGNEKPFVRDENSFYPKMRQMEFTTRPDNAWIANSICQLCYRGKPNRKPPVRVQDLERFGIVLGKHDQLSIF